MRDGSLRGYDHPAIKALMVSIRNLIEDGQPEHIVDDVIRAQLTLLAAADDGASAPKTRKTQRHGENLN